MPHNLLFILLSLLILPQSLSAGVVTDRIQSSQTLVVGTTGDFPPFTTGTTQGKLIGFDIDLARQLASALNVKLQIKQMEFAKLLPAVKDGKIDVALSGITMTPHRNLEVAFIGPYALSGQSLLGKETLIATLTSNEKLANATFKVAVLEGTTSEKTAREGLPHVKLTMTNTHDQSLMLLIDGKVDAILADLPFCRVAEIRYPQHNFKSLDNTLTLELLGIAISGEDHLFHNLLQNFLLIMEQSGTLQNMKDYWFKSNSWIKEIPDMDFFKELEK
jgi:polar amino acid transport system substrate-binding protein